MAQAAGTARPNPIPGVKRLDEKRAALQRRLVLVVTIVPFAGFIWAVASFWGRGLSRADAW